MNKREGAYIRLCPRNYCLMAVRLIALATISGTLQRFILRVLRERRRTLAWLTVSARIRVTALAQDLGVT